MRAFLAAASVVASAMPGAGQEAVGADSAYIRGLDTITGEVSEFEVRVDEPAAFGRLKVLMKDCRYLPENPSTHSFAYLEISEAETGLSVFNAWMIASAPALSAMEHPRYDIWLIRCNADAESPQNG